MSIRPTSLLRWLMQAKRETGLLELTPIKELLSQARNALTDSDTAQLDAELLLSHQLNKSRTWLHTWPDEMILRGTLADIAAQVRAAKITRTALILVGHALDPTSGTESRLYASDHVHLFRHQKSKQMSKA